MSRFGKNLPRTGEMERYGASGEEAILRLVRDAFPTVIQNPILPHGNGFLEKDLLVIDGGVPFVIEVKNWRGTIRLDGRDAIQEKPDGTQKIHKNPAGTTVQFLREMKKYYHLEREPFGIVVFADPDCALSLPPEVEGVALLPALRLVPYIKSVAKRESSTAAPLNPAGILHCTRLYGRNGREFSKGILVNEKIPCRARDGSRVVLDCTKISYITVERHLFSGLHLYVTFSNNATGVFRAGRQALVVGCLDGSFCKFSLSAVRHMVL